MEELGIGRPSTYASIINILKERNYIVTNKKQLTPTNIGIALSTFLCKFFKEYVEHDFTAQLENQLDLISLGKLEKLVFLRNFF